MPLKYATVLNKDLGLCAVSRNENSDENFYKTLGMTLQEVEQSNVDQQWYLKEKCPHLSDTEKLSRAQETKHTELKSLMDDKRQELKVSYDNDTFDANEDAQANMIVLLKSFDLGAKSVSIRSTTEQTHVFSQSQAQELSMLMLGAVDSLYKEYWDFKDKLYQCTTVEEVNAISWS